MLWSKSSNKGKLKKLIFLLFDYHGAGRETRTPKGYPTSS